LAQPFRSPAQSLAGIGSEAASRVITAAADVALILDPQGVIRDLSFSADDLARDGYGSWVGQTWLDTVTLESRPKVEALLDEARRMPTTSWRQVNHPSPRGGDLPVLYSAIQIGGAGGVIAIGRNLRNVSVLQQRLVDAQQSLERDYERLRQAETRYRLLFEMASEAVLILEANSQKIVDANPAAGRMLGSGARLMIGRNFPDGFDEASTRSIQDLLAVVRVTGRASDVTAELVEGGRRFTVSASPFRQENTAHILVRLVPRAGAGEAQNAEEFNAKARLLDMMERLPDGFVLTDAVGRVLVANRAFLDLIQLTNEDQVRGESLERWLGRPGVDLNVLIGNLKERDSIRLFGTTLRGEFGTTSNVEISAVSAPDAQPPCLGFAIRSVARRLSEDATPGRELPRSVQQLTELIGRVPLKDLVRETTDVIERMCIEAALELTGDNRASAAEMLGLSRQSLYVKLRRYGIAELSAGEVGPGPAS